MLSIRSLLALLRGKRKLRPQDMPSEALAAALAEAKKLKDAHGVDVQPVAIGELPVPKRAED